MTVEERYYKYTRTYMLRKEFEMMKREMTKNDYMQITHFTKLCLRLPLRSVCPREILFGYRRYERLSEATVRARYSISTQSLVKVPSGLRNGSSGILDKHTTTRSG